MHQFTSHSDTWECPFPSLSLDLLPLILQKEPESEFHRICILRPNPRFGPQRYFQLPNVLKLHQTSIPNRSLLRALLLLWPLASGPHPPSLASHIWSGTRSLIIFLFPQSFSRITFLVALWLISQFRILSALGWPPYLSLISFTFSPTELNPLDIFVKLSLGRRALSYLRTFSYSSFLPDFSWAVSSVTGLLSELPTCPGLFCIRWCQSLPEVLFRISAYLGAVYPVSHKHIWGKSFLDGGGTGVADYVELGRTLSTLWLDKI